MDSWLLFGISTDLLPSIHISELCCAHDTHARLSYVFYMLRICYQYYFFWQPLAFRRVSILKNTDLLPSIHISELCCAHDTHARLSYVFYMLRICYQYYFFWQPLAFRRVSILKNTDLLPSIHISELCCAHDTHARLPYVFYMLRICYQYYFFWQPLAFRRVSILKNTDLLPSIHISELCCAHDTHARLSYVFYILRICYQYYFFWQPLAFRRVSILKNTDLLPSIHISELCCAHDTHARLSYVFYMLRICYQYYFFWQPLAFRRVSILKNTDLLPLIHISELCCAHDTHARLSYVFYMLRICYQYYFFWQPLAFRRVSILKNTDLLPSIHISELCCAHDTHARLSYVFYMLRICYQYYFFWQPLAFRRVSILKNTDLLPSIHISELCCAHDTHARLSYVFYMLRICYQYYFFWQPLAFRRVSILKNTDLLPSIHISELCCAHDTHARLSYVFYMLRICYQYYYCMCVVWCGTRNIPLVNNAI